MENKSKHPNHVIGWSGTHKELAIAIGNMSYDEMAIFADEFAAEIKRQGESDALRPSEKDPEKKREQLSSALLEAAVYFKKGQQKISHAWKISAPYMK